MWELKKCGLCLKTQNCAGVSRTLASDMMYMYISSIVSASVVVVTSIIPIACFHRLDSTLTNMVHVYLRTILRPCCSILLLIAVVLMTTSQDKTHLAAPFLVYMACVAILDCVSIHQHIDEVFTHRTSCLLQSNHGASISGLDSWTS
jgi:ABC-type transport system involved in cytochrome bd biosynthesis fused ATPase/permease subunit